MPENTEGNLVVDLGPIDIFAPRASKEASPQEKKAPTTAEPSKTEETGGDLALAKEPEGAKAPEPDRESSRKAKEAHEQVIDLIEDKFELMESGRLSGDELAQWFRERETFAEVANRSKRVKDRFRSLMAEGGKKTSVPTAEPKESPKPQTLTLDDLKKYDEERETRLMERLLERGKLEQAEAFAASRKLVDGDYDRLVKTANALQSGDPDLEWGDALETAHAATSRRKGSPVNLDSATLPQGRTEEGKPELDLGKGMQPLMTMDQFMRKR